MDLVCIVFKCSEDECVGVYAKAKAEIFMPISAIKGAMIAMEACMTDTIQDNIWPNRWQAP